MSSVRSGVASCHGSLMMLLWFSVMISMRANFWAETFAGPPRPRPPPRPPACAAPAGGGPAGACPCATPVAVRPATAATPEVAPVRNFRRFIEILLHSIHRLCRRWATRLAVLRQPVGIARIIVRRGREFNGARRRRRPGSRVRARRSAGVQAIVPSRVTAGSGSSGAFGCFPVAPAPVCAGR